MPRRNILLNEDAELQKVLGESFFRRIGFNLLVAANVEQAFEIIEEQDPVLVLLAVGEPGWDGESFCRQLKEDAVLRTTPIILIVPSGNEEAVARCRASGCDDILSRPIDSQRLLAAACRVLNIVERAASRLSVHLPAQFGRDSRKLRPGEILNLNAGGLFVKADRLHPVGTLLSLEFSLPGFSAPIRCRAKVAWVNHPEWVKTSSLPSGMGLQFLELADTDQAVMNTFIEEELPAEKAG